MDLEKKIHEEHVNRVDRSYARLADINRRLFKLASRYSMLDDEDYKSIAVEIRKIQGEQFDAICDYVYDTQEEIKKLKNQNIIGFILMKLRRK